MTEYNNAERSTTERLRQLLDERGVEWARGRYDRREFTRWYIRNNSGYIAASFRDVLADGNGKPFLRCEFYEITPEQAVEATLGPAVPPPEPPVVPYDLLIDELRDTWGIEACWDGLRKFWYLGWTDEHVEDMGRLHDELCDAVAEASTVKAHRILDKARYAGRGTCRYDFVPNIGNGFLNACGLKCSCCGREQMSMDAPKFCPDCGMRVEDEQ